MESTDKSLVSTRLVPHKYQPTVAIRIEEVKKDKVPTETSEPRHAKKKRNQRNQLLRLAQIKSERKQLSLLMMEGMENKNTLN